MTFTIEKNTDNLSTFTYYCTCDLPNGLTTSSITIISFDIQKMLYLGNGITCLVMKL